MRTKTAALLKFAQIFDGAFPSGAFAHSFGLEAHILSGAIDDYNSLKRFLGNLILDDFRPRSFPFVKEIYAACQAENLSLILRAERRYVAGLSASFAAAARAIGENYFLQIGKLPPRTQIAKRFFDAIEARNAEGCELALLSVFAFDCEAVCEDFLALWAKKQLTLIAAASIKISRIKPTEIQTALFEMDEALNLAIKNPSKTVNNFNPLFDFFAYRHKRLEPRLFST